MNSREERKRLLSRERQRRFREKRVAYELKMVEETKMLKQQVDRLSLYSSFLAEMTVLRPTRILDVRRVILDVYADYFQFGVDPNDTAMYMKQKNFLQLHFKEHESIFHRWSICCSLHEHSHFKRIAIHYVSDNILRLVIEMRVIITHRAIAALYPHMLHDSSFCAKAMGKLLTFRATRTCYFNEKNQIQSGVMEPELVQGWYELLQDPVQTAAVMKQSHLTFATGTINDTERIQIRWEFVPS